MTRPQCGAWAALAAVLLAAAGFGRSHQPAPTENRAGPPLAASAQLSARGLRPGMTRRQVQDAFRAQHLSWREEPGRPLETEPDVFRKYWFNEATSPCAVDFHTNDLAFRVSGDQLWADGRPVLRVGVSEGRARELLGEPDRYRPVTPFVNGGAWSRRGLWVLFRCKAPFAPADNRHIVDRIVLETPNQAL